MVDMRLVWIGREECWCQNSASAWLWREGRWGLASSPSKDL